MEEDNSTSLWIIYSMLALSIIGFIGNTLIVVATVISKRLQSRCQILIAVLAATDAVVCAYLVQLRLLILTDAHSMKNSDCFLISIHGLFGLNVQAGMGLVIGMDRLMAVSAPVRYKTLSSHVYVVMLAVVCLYALSITVKGFLDCSDHLVSVCLPPTAYNGSSRAIWVASSFAVAVLVLVVYAYAHYKCRTLSASSTNASSLRSLKRLLGSLSIVVGVYACTWFLTVSALFVVSMVSLSHDTVEMINQQLGWLVIINSSVNFFIYLLRSSEYRKAFVFILTAGKSSHPNLDNDSSNQQHFLTQARAFSRPSVVAIA